MGMTKAERDQLLSLVKKREKVMKSPAKEEEALTKIERMSLEAQMAIVAHGPKSETAKDFLDMPPVQIAEVQSLVETRKAQRRLGYMN